MTVTREFFVFLCATVIIMALRCAADHHLPAPVNLSYTWLDPFVVNVTWSWNKPRHLPDNCSTEFAVNWQTKGREKEVEKAQTRDRYYKQDYLTEEIGSGQWSFTVKTMPCGAWKESKPTTIIIKTRKPHAKVVKDFKGYIEPNKLRFSWIPVNPSLGLNVSYRYCGSDENNIKGLKECNPSDKGMTTCELDFDTMKSICVCAETETGFTTFKPRLVIPVPDLRIKLEKDLLLQFEFPQVGQGCLWNFYVNYTECGEQKEPQMFKLEKNETTPRKIAYKETCRYEFNYTVKSISNCLKVSGDGSRTVHYGKNIPPDGTLTVVAIVLPIVLCACVILSCYCFRRHSAIICPVIPDPSAIFKEMMMNGNKELKTTGSLYAPMPEPIEPCRIALASEEVILQQNS